MGLFSGSPTPQQVTQRHQHSMVANGSGDVPLSQEDDVKSVIARFVRAQPAEVYIIDGKKGQTDSVIIGGGVTQRVPTDFVTLFKAMQLMNYYCLLPHDVKATHFECRYIK